MNVQGRGTMTSFYKKTSTLSSVISFVNSPADFHTICDHLVSVSRPYYKKSYNQIGSSMIEVLVSLFIMAMGLLGILSLQISAINSVQRTLFISEAQLLAADMADHILAHGISGKDAVNGDFVSDTSTNNDKAVDCSIGCSEADQISYIHAKWQKALQSRLPSGIGAVTWDSAHLTYTIKVTWYQQQGSIVSPSCGSSNTNTTCFVLQLKL